ncbi:Mitochondrial import receptor subunit TOM70 [Cichlidogyrus casuarinus]|uniref:Mitochondrial import receptor subunit TOM70 n=1 Tax=Cichlidogyrus casuarinus TaxID=1844966 RepID=A0ABD2QLQ0_9PLAT
MPVIILLGFRTGISYKTLLICSAPVAIYAIYTTATRLTNVPASTADFVDKSLDTPLGKALALKDKGNKYFKGSKYEQAIECYNSAIQVCPPEAVLELSIFYQNRAAAKENLGDIEGAISDCTEALKYAPRYVKALIRRAKLYERTSKTYQGLIDATAVSIFEAFSNVENVMFMERVLTRLANEKTELEKENIAYILPSNSFIHNYISAFDWDPIFCDETQIIRSSSIFTNAIAQFEDETIRLPFDDLSHCLSFIDRNTQVFDFLNQLKDALLAARSEDFPRSYELIQSAMKKIPPANSSSEMAYEKLEIFISYAKLLNATYKALIGDSANAEELLDQILKTFQETPVSGIQSIINGNDHDAGDIKNKLDWSKYPGLILIKMNALIKKACIAMTSDHVSCM